jgi:hypothetical protein
MHKAIRPTDNPYLKLATEGAQHYRRQRHLPALLALWPSELDDFGPKNTADIIKQLESALQAERRRGRSRHWCYDLNRHMALASALKGEQNILAGTGQKPQPTRIKT